MSAPEHSAKGLILRRLGNGKQSEDERGAQEVKQEISAFQQRIAECERRINVAIKEDIPDTAEILKKNAVCRKQLESQRDTKMKEIDAILAEIDVDIAAWPNIEENAAVLKSLQEEKRIAIDKRNELGEKFTVLLNKLEVDKNKTLKTSCAAISETIKIGKAIIAESKEELTLLQEELALLKQQANLELDYTTWSYFSPSKDEVAQPATSQQISSGSSLCPKLSSSE